MHNLIRPIEPKDNPHLAKIIRQVMESFGAKGEGFSIMDPEVDHMFQAYNKSRHAYFVVEEGGRVLGGAGIGPLPGAPPTVCELKKMYFLEAARGRGLGQALLEKCLGAAKEFNYQQCYLETLATMTQAQKLYERFHFQRLQGPLGNTGHHGCNSWYLLDL